MGDWERKNSNVSLAWSPTMSVKCCGLVLPGNFKLNFATTTCSIKNLMLSEIITMLIQIFSLQYKKVGTGDCLMSDTPADLYCSRF